MDVGGPDQPALQPGPSKANGAHNGAHNGTLTPQNDVLASGFGRSDVVRLITQSLHALGYHRSAELLEGESQIKLLSAEVSAFRQGVLDGSWDEAGSRIAALGLESREAACAVQFLILEQKFLELVDDQRFEPALEVLRAQLVPLGAFPEKLRTLASFLLCAQRDELRERCGWAAIGVDAADVRTAARQRLLHELQALIPPSVLIPEGRLETLLLQAMAHQTGAAASAPLPLLPAIAGDASMAGGSCARWDLFRDNAPPSSQLASESKRLLEQHCDEVWYLAFSHSGAYLASAGKDGLAVVWAVHGGAEGSGGAAEGGVGSRASSEGSGAYAAEDGMARDGEEGCCARSADVVHVLSGHAEPVPYLQWSPDDCHLLTCCNDGELKLWAASPAATGECARTYRRHTQAVQACAWLPDGRHFVSGGLDKLLLLWAVGGAVLQAWQGVRVHDVAIGAIAAGVSQLVALCADKKLRLYKVQTCAQGEPRLSSTEERALPVSRPVTSCALSSDCRQLLVSTASDEVELWDLRSTAADAEPIMRFVGQKQSRFVIRSAFGGHAERFVISGSEDSQVYIWKRADGALLEVLPGHSGAVNAVAWSPVQHDLFASASDDHTVRIWGPKLAPAAGKGLAVVQRLWQ